MYLELMSFAKRFVLSTSMYEEFYFIGDSASGRYETYNTKRLTARVRPKATQ